MIRKTAIATAALLLSLNLALAQDATKPAKKVDIEADQMEINDAAKQAVFKGSVKAVRDDVAMNSDVMTVTYAEVKQSDGTTKTDATNLDAKGNVTIKTRKETITGDWAKYDPQTEKLVVGGKVKLVQGATVLTGPELHADLKTNKIEMTGGRVKGSFLPQ